MNEDNMIGEWPVMVGLYHRLNI